MDEIDEFLNELLPSLEEEYHKFCADPSHPFTDGPISRVSFYTALLLEMETNPVVDEDEMVLQKALETRVIEMRNKYVRILNDAINSI